jgi:redox-sensitive bicupin YhaK (pirin superfamily)
MAAVTADTLVLPRVKGAGLGDVERPVLAVSTGPTGFEGEGFPVRRTMAGIKYQYLDPFIMMDHMGEVDYAAGEPRGTNWHPHRGFETVTYLVDGQFIHQDTHGGGGVIREGSTQWMTAGSGLLHIETPPEKLVEEGGLFNGFQLWVNLPAKDKWLTPKYQPVEASDLLLLASADGGALLRVIAGDVDGHVGPGSTHTPITLLHASVAPGAQLSLPWQPTYNALAYVYAGSGTVCIPGRRVGLGRESRIVDAEASSGHARHPSLPTIQGSMHRGGSGTYRYNTSAGARCSLSRRQGFPYNTRESAAGYARKRCWLQPGVGRQRYA